ncbi:hypothetical protein O181_006978 [Austropuccinia psidii MF-1]|uniref:Uncharacterized protein n=1 Tax=Austropuccinia psidii MF-1 TaxID=1389203 RepID=A0A9Q3BLI0_9BASI|nr:hypothetical protein [Austropuccinia psidii MF-1]
MLSSSQANLASSSKNSSRKRKRRLRNRSVSILTSNSADLSSSFNNNNLNLQLETVKSAAIKLLDNSFIDSYREPLTSSIKINNQNSPSIKNSQALNRDINDVKNQKELQNLTAPSSSSSGNLSQPDLQSTNQNLASFQVNREEIFSDHAIIDAFNAAVVEFKSYQSELINSSNPISLPQSRHQRRQISALYYGQPPQPMSTANKKPSLFSVISPTSTNEKETKTSSSPDITAPRANSVCSSLDIDEYNELFGEMLSTEPLNEIEKLKRIQSDQPNQFMNEEDDQSMDVGSDSSSGVEDQQSNPIRTAITDPALLHPHPLPDPPITQQLTAAQKVLLSNALNAQYWAGYHVALFNRSIGSGMDLNICNKPSSTSIADASTSQNGNQNLHHTQFETT